MSTPSQAIEIEPIITYPRKAEAGKTYVMTVDLRQRLTGAEWPYETEEYAIYCMLDSGPLFSSEPVGEPSVVLHRFGGTFGPAMFILTASEKKMRGMMRLSLVSETGMPLNVIELPDIEITKEALESRASDIAVGRKSSRAKKSRKEESPARVPDPVPGAPPGFLIRHTLKLPPCRQPAGDIVWSPDGKILIVPADNVQFWDAETGEMLRTLRTGPRNEDETVGDVVYSPDGSLLAVVDEKYQIEIWDTAKWSKVRVLKGHAQMVSSLVWSPDGRRLVSTSGDKGVIVWEVETGELYASLDHHRWVMMASFAPDGRMLATGNSDSTASIFDPSTLKVLRVFEGHTGPVYSVAWSPIERTLVSGGGDHKIRIWDPETGECNYTLDKHEMYVIRLSFSADGRFLASKSSDGITMLWRSDTWEWLATFDEKSVGAWASSPAFHPTQPNVLATLGEAHKVVHIWELDVENLLDKRSDVEIPPQSTAATESYAVAKVVILGDSGAGKSGLFERLTSNRFAATALTHGAQTWLFEGEVTIERDRSIRRDILLWDLAGQPNYHLLHQFQLADTSLAVIVFDASSDSAFPSVRYWVGALRQVKNSSVARVPMVLVATRKDRGGTELDRERIDRLIAELGFDAYYETSAQTGEGVDDLRAAIRTQIDWSTVSTVTTTTDFLKTRESIVRLRDQGVVMATEDELYALCLSYRNLNAVKTELRSQFQSWIEFLAVQGLIRLFPIGNYVLLRPEYFDIYASAIIRAAREEPEGLGSIRLTDAAEGRFHMPVEERLQDVDQDKALRMNVVEELSRIYIAWLQTIGTETWLVFPTLVQRRDPDPTNPSRRSAVFIFEGAFPVVYVTLLMSLVRNEFRREEMWKNAALFSAPDGGSYKIVLREIDQARIELTVFFDESVSQESKLKVESLVYEHLQSRALPGTVYRQSPDQSEIKDDQLSTDIGEGAEPSVRSFSIFLSSTVSVLAEYREAVIATLTSLGHRSITFDLQPSGERPAFPDNRLIDADVYLCILGWSYGYVPEGGDGRSVTEMEYDRAMELGKPIIAFLAASNLDVLGRVEASEAVLAFRHRVASTSNFQYYTGIPDLEAKVATEITRLAAEFKPKEQTSTETVATDVPTQASIKVDEAESSDHSKFNDELRSVMETYTQQVDEFSILLELHDLLHQFRWQVYPRLIDLIQQLKNHPRDQKIRGQLYELLRTAQIEKVQRVARQARSNRDFFLRAINRLKRAIKQSETYENLDELDRSIKECNTAVFNQQELNNRHISDLGRELSNHVAIRLMGDLLERAALLRTDLHTRLLSGQDTIQQMIEEFGAWNQVCEEVQHIATSDLRSPAFRSKWTSLKTHIKSASKRLPDGNRTLDQLVRQVDATLGKPKASLPLERLSEECANHLIRVVTTLSQTVIAQLSTVQNLIVEPPGTADYE